MRAAHRDSAGPARRLTALLALAALLAAATLVAVDAPASGRSLSKIRSEIERTRARLAAKQGRARILTTDITALSHRIGALQGRITVLERREAVIQVRLDRERAALLRIQDELNAERARLERLRAKLARGRRVLARRLVELYEGDRPDIVTVVLNAHGFADLLETGHYVARIGAQDERIITWVRHAKAQTTRSVARLGRLEARQHRLTVAVLVQRNQVDSVRSALVRTRQRFAAARATRAATLARLRAQAASLHSHLDVLQSQAAAIERRIQAAQSGGAAVAGPLPAGGGALSWPVNGPITSPFCERRAWESCHPGIDIGVPSGTPIHAAGSGRVIIAGQVSGYGNYTCIQHTGAMSSCYGHQSRILVSVGQSVSRGQVIGYSGCTGLCFGPHLHFEVRINGAVVNPLNYL